MQYSIDTGPPRVGGYRLGDRQGFVIALDKKPRWIHRQMMRLAFGWVWEDIRR